MAGRHAPGKEFWVYAQWDTGNIKKTSDALGVSP